ncbi:MAG: omptin family outer membrane protease [Candidatus Omnitrophica bacterium]|nr:omptin family outer membrane protease [Candidatus Omnitrophota bacterium]
MDRQKIALFFVLFLSLPLTTYAIEGNLGSSVIGQGLYAANQAEMLNKNLSSQKQTAGPEKEATGLMGAIKGFTKSFKANDGYLDLGLRTGYIYGQNSFDWDHHTSELEFPFRAYLGGGIINLGYKDFSINSEFWGSLVDDPSAGWHMKDKDWTSGKLISDTKSNSSMNAVIWDVNLRYNFFKYSFTRKAAKGEDKKTDNIKVGVLLGYRYERFGYKAFGLYQTCGTEAGYGDQQVLEYKVKYRLPYYGLAVDVGNDKFGILMNAKYAFNANAQDLDNHVLHSRTTYGKYEKDPNVFMGNAVMFWNFTKNWKASMGADVALIRIDGLSWAESHDPAYDGDQSIDTKQFIYWVGLGYRF